MIVDLSPQRSPAWFRARLGCLTGSRAKDALATIKTGEAKARYDYRLQLALERLSGQPQEPGFVNEAMQRGIDCEPLARFAFMASAGLWVEEAGFLRRDDLPAGCSVDGLIADGTEAGFLEIKCPAKTTMADYHLTLDGTLPSEHRLQIVHNFWVLDHCTFAWFYAWDDRMPGKLGTYSVRVTRAALDKDLREYDTKARAFLADVETLTTALTNKL